MKKAVMILIFSMPLLLWAQTGFFNSLGPLKGAGANIDFRNTTFNDKNSSGEETAYDSRLVLSPSLHFFLDDKTEFVPYLTLGLQWESNQSAMTRDGSSNINFGGSRFTLGAGTSFFWHFLDSWKIKLLTGFRLDLHYTFEETGEGAPTGEAGDPKTSQLNMGVYIPMGMDFKLTKNLTLRLTGDMVRLGLTMDHRQEGTIGETDYVTGSSFPFLVNGDTALSLSVIYYFED